MINTRSSFIYGYTVGNSSFSIDFNEGGSELQASLNIGSYTFGEFADEISRQMNLVGGQEYTVTIDRDTRLITISAPGNFTLLVTTGTRSGVSAFGIAGFTSDKTGSNSYTSDVITGTEFRPQFKLQDYVDFEDNQSAQAASVSVTAGNQVQVVSFGTEKIAEMNIKYQTNQSGRSSNIERDPQGVENLRNFLIFATTKSRFEFFKDRDNKASFTKVILESTPSSRDGVGFKLNELFGGGSDWFESGIIKLRQVV
jgi:hypothetical protein